MTHLFYTAVALVLFMLASAVTAWLGGWWAFVVLCFAVAVICTACLAGLRGCEPPPPQNRHREPSDLDLTRMLQNRPDARERDELNETGRTILRRVARPSRASLDGVPPDNLLDSARDAQNNPRDAGATNGHTKHPERKSI